jgi:DNA mismatch repair protein PMS2
MATIKPIEARSIHQIQSGQVIVDLCSVVKELVENCLDAGATSLEVRFKNNGLDSIEVQDNGSGISPSNYESLALKHYTSKLASYDDLSSLRTFGFRGEALSSLCALSTFYVVTALADEAPKGKRLDFEQSGKLKSATVVAAQKGTTAVVEGLFEQLPVRRKELTKNIKKEYGKVLGLLHAYACVGTNVKFTVKNSMPKGKNATVFSTKGNPTSKENIANVYGAKTLSALVPLDLQLDFQSTSSLKKEANGRDNQIIVQGHISRPVFGEGRQTPDRQMFFVNGRPCGLPQIAKAFNEVYKSFNVSQSPFIFADLKMDTNAYDVNVSPDKRTIMLHDSAGLVDSLKSSLTELFDRQEQTVPQSQVQASRLPAYKQLTIARESTAASIDSNQSYETTGAEKNGSTEDGDSQGRSLLHDFFRDQISTREEPKAEVSEAARTRSQQKFAKALEEEANDAWRFDGYDDAAQIRDVEKASNQHHAEQTEDTRVRDFNLRIAEQQTKAASQIPIASVEEKQPVESSSTPAPTPPRTNAVQNAFDRMRPNRPAAEMATITVGDKTITTMVGSQPRTPSSTPRNPAMRTLKPKSAAPASNQAFIKKLKSFAASGSPDAQTSAEPILEVESLDRAEDLTSTPDDASSKRGSTSVSQQQQQQEEEEEEEYEHATSEDVETKQVDRVNIPEDDTDGEYIDEGEKKAQEDATVAELIRAAEEKAISLNANILRRANKILKSGASKDSTASLQVTIAPSEQFQDLTNAWQQCIKEPSRVGSIQGKEETSAKAGNEEELLALTVSKTDFSNMHIVGQFNLGFILAVRAPSDAVVSDWDGRNAEDLFIVDQHASDEKFNFERLQTETVVGNQTLVRPKQLELTAVEEEVLMENYSALEKNGFIVSIDTSENEPIGQRCKLISLPLSKEVTFGLEDLEELLHLLAESPGLSQSSMIPRPSKVRKMFAMRACRSSIMIGKTLTEPKMRTVVSHMGEIDRPWNCPHGRPTMRHLMTLNAFETWQEGDGVAEMPAGTRDNVNIWVKFVQ